MLKSKITSLYESHDKARICQGDILRDFKYYYANDKKTYLDNTSKIEISEVIFNYSIILSQDCDLESGQKIKKPSEPHNQYLPSILFIPAFTSQTVKDGSYLSGCFKISQRTFGKEQWEKVSLNKEERYHFLKADPDLQVPELVLDFKLYFTVFLDVLKKEYNNLYLSTVNELFREQISQRFSFYLSRIGLPEIQKIPVASS